VEFLVQNAGPGGHPLNVTGPVVTSTSRLSRNEAHSPALSIKREQGG